MYRIKIIFNLLLLIFAVACQSNAQKSTKDGKHFGEVISAENAITYDALLPQLAEQKEVTTKVQGKVESVCQMKGCWITIVSAEAGKPAMFVKFKDYGFFMPKDLAGKTVVMQGKAFTEETSVDELRHYAEDEGKTKAEIEAITAPKKEYKFMASGVVILD